MEEREFISDDFNYSPRPNQGFHSDRYVRTFLLDIPDTIPENCSAEISEESLKMKVSKHESENGDEENISLNSPANSVKSLDISPSIEIDHSYLKQCEKKLLECSYSDDERNNEPDNNTFVKQKLLVISKRNPNDTISTPPSLLKKEISILRSEMAEAHEFHDLEMQLLKEEKSLSEISVGNYLELFEKYSALMELYTSLKTEYDDYREEQEKVRHELETKTADCLESLCSQIETSDSSFNFSGISCLSFGGRARSSTMSGNLTEVECTVVQDATVLGNDPLSVTGELKGRTPRKSMEKWDSILEESLDEISVTTTKEDTSTPSQTEYYIKCLNLETALLEKVKEVQALEERLFKVESMSSDLQCEFDRISSVYTEENSSLKASLSLRSEQLNELKQELFSETVSLNPSLKDSLADVPGKKLLLVFMETIMESCKKIKGEDTMKTIEDLQNQLALQESKLVELDGLRKTCEGLEKKLSEMDMMKSKEIEMIAIKEKLLETDEIIRKLKSQLKSTEEENIKLQELCCELQKTNQNLVLEIISVKNLGNQSEDKSNEDDGRGEMISESEGNLKETSKVEELIREIEQLKNENSRFLKVLETVEKTQKHIAEMLLDVENSEMPSEKIGKLISDLSKLPDETKESEVIMGFIETIGKMCKRVQSELMKECENEKLEWEAQRLIDQELVKNLQDQIALLTVKSKEYETEISKVGREKEKLTEEYKTLKDQMTEAEKIISTLNQEIDKLRSQEGALEQTKVELTDAKKTIQELNWQLTSIECKNQEIELRCRELGRCTQDLQFAKEVITRELQEIKMIREIIEQENTDLKQQILQTEDEIRVLRKHLEKAEEEQTANETELETLENEINALKTERDRYFDLSDKLKHLEDSNKNLKEIFLDLREYLDMPEDMVVDINSGVLKNKRVFRERIDQLILTNVKNLERQIKKSEIETKEAELEALREKCEVLESRLAEAEKDIFARDEDIHKLREEVKQQESDFFAVKENLRKLESEMKSTADSKSALEISCIDFQKLMETLKEKIVEKENLCQELKIEKSVIETTHGQLKESYDLLKAQKTEVENLMFTRDEEIRILKSCEMELCHVKQNLNAADEMIVKLKSELQTAEAEKSEMVQRCIELEKSNGALLLKLNEAKKFENHPVYQEINTENSLLKQRIFESEQKIQELRAELDAAKQEQKINLLKADDLVREIDELRIGNTGFNCALETMEETRAKITKVLSEPDPDNSELPSERIMKLMKKTIPSLDEGKKSEFYSGFVSTITQTCQGVENKLIKKFNNERREWESQKEIDNEKLNEKLKKLVEANSEQSIALEQTKNQLNEADEMIHKLKSRLTETETEMAEMETRFRRLEENATTMKIEIDNRNMILKELEELKIQKKKVDSENGDLKQQILESEETLAVLKKCLELAKQEQDVRTLKIKDLEDEIKTEKKSLKNLSENLNRLENSNKKLVNVLSNIVRIFEMPEEEVEKLLSEGLVENSKVIDNFIRARIKGWKVENQNLKVGNETLKKKVWELDKLIVETATSEAIEEVTSLDLSHTSKTRSRAPGGKKLDLCVRRLDKLEELNHNLTELITMVLTMTEYPDLEKLKLYSTREFPKLMKSVLAHLKGFETRLKELQEENSELDEECETYANIIKDLKKKANAVWNTNKEKTEAMEAEIERLTKEKNCLEEEKQDLSAKISKLERESVKLKASKSEEAQHNNCSSRNESKKINELKRTLLLKEQKLLELQDLEAQTSSYKSQIEYLKTALERERKKAGEEKEKNQKLQNKLNEVTKNQKSEHKKEEGNEILDELRMCGSLSGGIVQEFVEKEKTKKLAKDIAILKELCRARYAEIKRLEAVNASLRNNPSKNSNQMDSPIRSRVYNTRSKNMTKDILRKTKITGKENSPL